MGVCVDAVAEFQIAERWRDQLRLPAADRVATRPARQ